MEAMYSELKDKFSGTNMERNGLEEAVGLFKARSKLYCVPRPQQRLTDYSCRARDPPIPTFIHEQIFAD
jgi:hypothetical protein